MPKEKSIPFTNVGGKEKDALFNLASSRLIDYELASLRLDLLKENFEYRQFYRHFKENPHLFLSISPIPDSDYPKKPKRKPLFTRATERFKCTDLRYYFERFNLNPKVELILWFLNWPFTNFVTMFDPLKELESVNDTDLKLALPLFFSPPGIGHPLPGYEHCFLYKIPKDLTSDLSKYEHLEPYQHIVIVDFRKSKEQLKSEFAELINWERWRHKQYNQQQGTYTFDKTYHEWAFDGRERLEAVQHLKVWQLRRLRMSFPKIATELGISEDNAKTSFYRAYELTQFKRYEPENLKLEVWRHQKSELKKTCDTCTERDQCTKLCPEALAYIDQDKVARHEQRWEENGLEDDE